MREIVEKATIKKFNVISVVFLIELIVVAVSAYPLFSINGNIGIIIWLCLFAITLYTASKIEKFKKSHNIQTYKEILLVLYGVSRMIACEMYMLEENIVMLFYL